MHFYYYFITNYKIIIVIHNITQLRDNLLIKQIFVIIRIKMSIKSTILQQQMKLIIGTLKEHDIIKLIECYLSQMGLKLQRSLKEISYKCFQCTCKIKNKIASGYGRNQVQSTTNSIKNLIEYLIDDQKCLVQIKETFKKLGYNVQHQYSQHNDSTNSDLKERSKSKHDFDRVALAPFSNVNNQNSLKKHDSENQKSKSQLKEEILEHFKLNHFKIVNPNSSIKSKHQNYLSQSLLEQDPKIKELRQANLYIKQLETKLKQATQQNIKLKQIMSRSQTKDFASGQTQNIFSKQIEHKLQKQLEYSGIYNQSKFKSNQSGHFQQKNKKVPRLKLEILPNYHGKSNKSLNQSLLQAYQKNKK